MTLPIFGNFHADKKAKSTAREMASAEEATKECQKGVPVPGRFSGSVAARRKLFQSMHVDQDTASGATAHASGKG